MKYLRNKLLNRLLKTACILLPLLLLAISLPVLAAGVAVEVDAPDEVEVGEDFIASVDIAGVTDLDCAVFRVRFDPDIIDLPTTDDDSDGIYDSITDGEVGGKTVKLLAMVWKESGLIGMTAQVQPALSGATGDGYIVELHFNAVSPGTGDIGLEHTSLSNIEAESITATWTGDSVDIIEAPSPVVGGTVYRTNKLALLAPWIGLRLAGLAIIAGAIIFLRRRGVWS